MSEPAPIPPRRNGNIVSTIATALVESFRVNPSLIAIVVLNVIVIAMLFNAVSRAMDAHDKRFALGPETTNSTSSDWSVARAARSPGARSITACLSTPSVTHTLREPSRSARRRRSGAASWPVRCVSPGRS